MPALLEVKNIRVSFSGGGIWGWGGKSVDGVADVSFSVASGETYAVVGESGSGKTTLLRSIAGLVPASGGSIRFDGREITNMSDSQYRPLRRDISVIFQDPAGSLSPRHTVHSLLTEPFGIHGIKNLDLRAEGRRLLEMVGLSADLAFRYPHQLSGGQARRVGVARALALAPKIILADEPTAGLDVSVQGELLNLFNDLRKNLGLAMIMITHNLNVIRHVADRMGIMYLGRMVEEGETRAIFSRPLHPYTLCLLSANPSLDPDARAHRVMLRGEASGIMHRGKGCEFKSRCPFAEEPLCMQTPPWTAGDDRRGWRCLKPLTAK